MNDRLITDPSVEPVSVDDLKAHSRVTLNDEDAVIAGYISAAREYIEGQTGRALAIQTREASFDEFLARHRSPHHRPVHGFINQMMPGYIRQFNDVIHLGLSPLISVESVKYLDEYGVEQVLDQSNYIANVRSEPGTIQPAIGKQWPATASIVDSVRVTYVCGYETPPAILRQAILFLAAHWYEQRQPLNSGNVSEIPHTLASIIWSNRVI